MVQIGKSTLSVYRDCLRLIEHIAGKSKKAQVVRTLVRAEFDKNKYETDPAKIDQLRSRAVAGLANYLTVESLSKLRKKGPKAQGPPDAEVL